MKITPDEARSLLELTVCEIPLIDKQQSAKSIGIETLADSLKPSRAILPAREPYFVGETDGPKHLYVLSLRGNICHYLGRTPVYVQNEMIIKVGFSKSPLLRRTQIQSAYPEGAFNLELMRPRSVPQSAVCANARIAATCEDKMKASLIENGARSLGREFFLAEPSQIEQSWAAGIGAAEQAARKGVC